MKCLRLCLLVWVTLTTSESFAQVSFFNMPNPDMMPVGSMYVEYDQYQTLKSNKAVNAYVPRASYQVLPYMEVGANLWFTHADKPDRIVLATKWRFWLYESEKIKLSMSPGNWSSIYFHDGLAPKHIIYDFLGLTIQHSDVIYTRLMAGAYGKIWKDNPGKNFKQGAIAGVEQRITKSLVFVTDYFGGSGEGYGLAPGFVYYATGNGSNLPIYLAYQFDNDDRKNDLLLFEIGYTFSLIN